MSYKPIQYRWYLNQSQFDNFHFPGCESLDSFTTLFFFRFLAWLLKKRTFKRVRYRIAPVSTRTAPHRYRRGHGFKYRTGLNFFAGLIFTTAEIALIYTDFFVGHREHLIFVFFHVGFVLHVLYMQLIRCIDKFRKLKLKWYIVNW